MTQFRVFLGAPAIADVDRDPRDYQWQTFSSTPPETQPRQTRSISIILPNETIDEAHRRISLLYENTIFHDSGEPDEDAETSFNLAGQDQTTLYTWPPTQDETNRFEKDVPFPVDTSTIANITTVEMEHDQEDTTRSRQDETAPSFLLDSSESRNMTVFSTDFEQEQTTMSTDQPNNSTKEANAPSFLMDISKSGNMTTFLTELDTQDLQETQSFSYSDSSSIAHFPTFHFSLHSLTSLSSLLKSSPKGTRKVTVLLAILEVDGPNTIRTKKGPKAGEEISILSLVAGDDQGTICKLTAWRDVAELWGGERGEMSVRRGDVVHIENVTVAWEAGTSPTLTASSYSKPKLQICYRTMPCTRQDNRLRFDLRLAQTDLAVRKVAAVVRWFEDMAGLR